MKVTKKLLSVLLSIIMIMTSMSVCFGTFVTTASAEDTDYISKLADKLKDSAYADTLALLGKSTKSGSNYTRTTTVSFSNYRNYKQAAELLRLLDNAMKQTDAWKKAVSFSDGSDGKSKTDQEAACNGSNTVDLYNDIIKGLEKKSVTVDSNITTFIGSVYHADGAVLHSSAKTSKSNNNWTNTVTYSTSDYKGYLAQIGKASAVEASAEMSVKYVVTMKKDLSYKSGCDTYYHHQLWPADTGISAPATNSTNTEMKSKVNAHISELESFINITYAEMLAMNETALDNKVAELDTAISNAVTYCGAQSTYDALYADYAAGIANFRTSIQSAKDFANFMPTVDAWNDFVEANPNYGVFRYPNFGVKGSEGHTKLLADYATFKAYRDYLLTGGSIYDYLVDYNYIDEAYYTNFYDNVVAYDLQDSKDAADALYAQYSAVNPGMEETEMPYEEKVIAYNSFKGFIDNLNNYSAQVVAAVYTDGWQYLIDMREYFKCEINPAVLYFAENAYKTFTELSTTALWDEINVAKGHQADLTALYNEVKANIGQDKADSLLSGLRADATTMIENLYKTLADRFTLEVNNAWDIYVVLGKPTALKVDTFLQLSAVMVMIETDILSKLQAAGKAGYITQTTIDRYNELMKAGGIYEIWNAYASTFGFPDYKQTEIKYDDRIPMEGDELKTANDPVTEAEMLKLIKALDTIITSDTVGNLLGGLLGAEAGEGFDLGAMLTDLIKGALFTDDFINTVVQMLYPLVLNEFNKVWADLPQSVEYSGMNIKVQYMKTLHTILQEGEFEIYPDLLASRLEKRGQSTKYADNIALLKAAGGEEDSWESPRLVDVETGKLKLTWGVTEQKEKLDAGEITQAQFDKFFYDAFEDATSGLLPLLTTLITNKAWTPAKCNNIGKANATLTTLDIALQLGSRATSGYANMLVPIYELLGVPYTAVSTIESSTYNSDVSYVLEQILTPVFTFLDKLGDAPVDTLLEVLPDLVYALAFRMAKPMLNMLNCDITYDASASLVGSVLADGAYIAVGDLLIGNEEDKLLKEEMFAGGLNSILAFFGLNIPAIDQAKLATLGELTTMSTSRKAWIYDNSAIAANTAYTIKADKADVAYYLLSYILGIVKDEASLRQLLSLFMTKEDENGEAVADTEAIDALINDTLYNDEGLNLDEINTGNAIAAIVELANQIEYGIDGYTWYAGEYSSPAGSSVAMDIYLNPNNDWTEDKAQYLYDNLEALLGSIFTMANLDLDAETEGVQTSVEDALGGVLGGLFSNKTVTALAKLLGSLSDLNALLAGGGEEAAPDAQAEGEEAGLAIDINKIIKDELGIDLSVYAQYKDLADDAEINFGVTDAATFVNALTELLAPVKPLLDFILGGKDLTLIDSAITLQGYKGYDNAIIPLLEALGATPAAYTEGADTLALTLNALVGVINKLTTNDPAVEKDGAIYTIIDMLPGVLYYISSNALSQGVDKLLTPVYAVLDTIRPIYNINLNDLLSDIEIGEEGNKKPLGLDIKNITWSFIFGLLNNLVGLDLSALQQAIYDVSKVIGEEYNSASALQSTWKKGAYNANFSQADMLTVILSFVLEWATVKENADKLDELLKTNGIIASLNTVFADVEITYGTPDWAYWFSTEDEFNAYLAGDANIPNTLAALDWENIESNDWNLEAAKYFADNLPELVDLIIGMINKDKVDEDGNALPTNLSDLLSGLVNGLVNAETINSLVGMLTNLLADIDENLINTAGYLLDIDLAGLMAYTCKAEINTISDFINELAVVLDTYAGGLVNWLFFGDDYRFAKKSDSTDTIVINGGLGYEKGLAMILEALGCELPEKPDTKSVLGALATRVEEIFAAPVDEIIELLPNLVYFLNANGAGVALNNILQPVYALLDKLSAFGLNVNIADLLKFKAKDGSEIVIDPAALSLENVVAIVEGATDLPLDAAENILVNFCTGKITKGEFIYKMEAAEEDVITILLVVALELVSDDAFAAKLDKMLGTDFIAQLKNVFAGVEIDYASPEWEYPLADNGTVDVMKYTITYPNNWTEATAQYVADNLPEIADLIAGLIDSNYDSLSALLKANVNVFTGETLESLVSSITNLLGGIDDGLLDAAGVLLGADVVGLKKYEAPAGIDTVDEFAAELANILNTHAKGIVEWLLLGDDYNILVKDADGIGEGLVTEGSYITVTGADGYAEGLALLLEALGCEDLPAADGATEEIVTGVLTSVAELINKILDNPVATVLDILPNVLYFLNANGVAAVVDNTLAAVTALIEKLAVFGVNVDINSLVNIKSLLKLGDEAAISLDNLSMAAVLEAVSLMVGLDLTLIEDVLVGFALGEVKEYDSVSASAAYKMSYKDEFDKHDMVTVLVNLVLLTIVDEDNAEFVKGLVGEAAYTVILNLCNGVAPVAIQEFDWQFTDKADTGEVFSAFESSELYEGYSYGPLYTEEMAEYIADNFGQFVDNILYLLGIEINGVTVNNLTDLINGLLNGSLYNSSNVIAIRDALAGVLAGIEDLEVNGKNVGKYIAAVLANSEVADISAVADVEVPEFTEDREQFVASLCDVLEPLYPVLKWLLADDDIAFFVDLEKNDLIKLEGAEGYAYGIIPLLETLECEGILAPADYNAAVDEDGSVLLTSILNPLLDRVDAIVADDPASAILAMLPNIIYFINSNGVDTVIKNTLNAVYTLLSAIEPIAAIDLYELLGVEFLETLDFETLFQMLLDLIADATGYKFENIDASAVEELTVGTLESYTSLNEKTAYKMVYNEEASKDEMVTVVLRLLVTFIMHENNREMLLGLLKDNLGMSEDAEGYLRGVLDSIASLATDTYLGMDQALAVIYYLFYSADIGSAELVNGIKDINAEWQNILKELSRSEDPDEITIGDFLGNFLDKYMEDVFTSDGFAPNGLIAFFQRIIEWFNKIVAWFKALMA